MLGPACRGHYESVKILDVPPQTWAAHDNSKSWWHENKSIISIFSIEVSLHRELNALDTIIHACTWKMSRSMCSASSAEIRHFRPLMAFVSCH